jgi:tyrosyl-tRNA synthetase
LTMPLLEGTDGVQKMSKSYGNYIGINEPPQQIYGKAMSISDELMWRYYELLTDVKVPEIEQMKADAASGKQHPMQIKKALARRIVQDFHGEQAAATADENWAKQFQKDEVPEDVEKVEIAVRNIALDSKDSGNAVALQGGRNLAETVEGPFLIRVDKLLREVGLADSGTDGVRKIKQNAVRINGQLIPSVVAITYVPMEHTVKVGRRVKNVALLK